MFGCLFAHRWNLRDGFDARALGRLLTKVTLQMPPQTNVTSKMFSPWAYISKQIQPLDETFSEVKPPEK